MDGCNVLPLTQFVGNRLRVDTTRVLSVGGSLPPCGAAGERSEFNIKSPLGQGARILGMKRRRYKLWWSGKGDGVDGM